MPSPNSSRSRSSVPQSSGESTPGGGGACLAIVLNILPTAPSGVQLAIPIRPPGLTTAQQLGGRLRLVGGEHRAEDRHRHVEARVLEGQVLGVGLDELDLEPLGRGTLAAALEQGRDVVGADRVAPGAPRRRDRPVAAAAGDVEHPLAGNEVERLGEVLAGAVDDAGDHREVALRPDLLLDLA